MFDANDERGPSVLDCSALFDSKIRFLPKQKEAFDTITDFTL